MSAENEPKNREFSLVDLGSFFNKWFVSNKLGEITLSTADRKVVKAFRAVQDSFANPEDYETGNSKRIRYKLKSEGLIIAILKHALRELLGKEDQEAESRLEEAVRKELF